MEDHIASGKSHHIINYGLRAKPDIEETAITFVELRVFAGGILHPPQSRGI